MKLRVNRYVPKLVWLIPLILGILLDVAFSSLLHFSWSRLLIGHHAIKICPRQGSIFYRCMVNKNKTFIAIRLTNIFFLSSLRGSNHEKRAKGVEFFPRGPDAEVAQGIFSQFLNLTQWRQLIAGFTLLYFNLLFAVFQNATHTGKFSLVACSNGGLLRYRFRAHDNTRILEIDNMPIH